MESRNPPAPLLSLAPPADPDSPPGLFPIGGLEEIHYLRPQKGFTTHVNALAKHPKALSLIPEFLSVVRQQSELKVLGE